MRRLRVLRPIQSIEEVQASLDTFGGKIAGRLDARQSRPGADAGAGGSASGHRQVFAGLGRELESLRRKVVGAEDEHVRRLARVVAIRRRSEELGKDLYQQQVAARRILGGAYDPGRGFELAAISGTTPRTLKPLEEQVDLTVKLLRRPVAETPTVRLAGVAIDLGEVADGLALKLRDLRAKRADLERARKASGESKVLLDRALEKFQAAFPWIAQALEAFARMAGEPELAERVRTSIRRVTRRQGESEATGADQAPSDEIVSVDKAPDAPSSGETTSAGETSSGRATSATEPVAASLPSRPSPDRTAAASGHTVEPPRGTELKPDLPAASRPKVALLRPPEERSRDVPGPAGLPLTPRDNAVTAGRLGTRRGHTRESSRRRSAE